MNKEMRVMIVGGGIGGLCLAQGLRKAGIEANVYERDRTPSARLQGYRIHIDPAGSTALHACLPPQLWELFDGTGGDFSDGFTMLDEQLEELMKFLQPAEADDAVARHRQVSRMTLRQILLGGLGERVHFDKRFVRYERLENGRIAAFFEDGSSVEADILVAADGVSSRVRQQYLPGNEPVDTGVISIGGKIPLTDGVMAMIPPALLDGPAIVLPPAPANLFMAAWRRSADAEQRLRALGFMSDETADNDSYVIMALGGKREYFGLEGVSDAEIDAMSQEEMRSLLRSRMVGWHPNLRKLAEMTGDGLGFWRIRTSRPAAAWKPSQITLLGDAIHSMTPFRGIGANVALHDAQLLCEKLTEAVQTGASVVEKIGEYESEMRSYGFEAVAESLKSLEQAVSPKRAGFKVGMKVMQIASRIPVVRKRIMEQRVTRPVRPARAS